MAIKIHKSSFYQQKLAFPDSFIDTFNIFLEMIELDLDIKATVDSKYLYKGLFSPAVRFLIQQYVDERRESFLEKKKRKIAKGEDEDA
jgi:hypothetical protein